MPGLVPGLIQGKPVLFSVWKVIILVTEIETRTA